MGDGQHGAALELGPVGALDQLVSFLQKKIGSCCNIEKVYVPLPCSFEASNATHILPSFKLGYIRCEHIVSWKNLFKIKDRLL